MGGEGKDRAFVSAPDGGELFDLNTLIEPADPLYGVTVKLSAAAINDRGQIVGSALVNGTCRALLATPVPFQRRWACWL